MWIYTTFGMFSVIEDPDDDKRVVVRARDKEHLHQLLNRTGNTGTIIDTPQGDYACRVFMSRKKWARVSESLMNLIDYTNFKNACEVRVTGSHYQKLLIKVWEATWSALCLK